MPKVNWDLFKQLPGSAEYNFEILCRSIIRLHYSRYGRFVALANQPGVEFHIKLHTECSLGEPGRWYGWQCKWYDLPSGRSLGSARKRKIEDSIKLTERVLPGMTDWVLWTRNPLTAGDQKWFYNIKTTMHLELRTLVDIEELLIGEAEMLRSTYFGDLILTPANLEDLHRLSSARIRQRWLPEAHQIVNAERVIRKILGNTNAWSELSELSKLLKNSTSILSKELNSVPASLAEMVSKFIKLTHSYATILVDVYEGLSKGDFDLLAQIFQSAPATIEQDIRVLPRKLRNARHKAGLIVTNTLSDILLSITILNQVEKSLKIHLVSVTSSAGGGKTQLSAQITSTISIRPPGILLFGQDLYVGKTLDDLAQRIVIQGNPVRSMEMLLGAVNAAGQRAQKRIPICIDGLNEAEDPREWKRLLGPLNELLGKYPYVLVICTLRPDFVADALPDTILNLEIPDFGVDTKDAIQKYFDYYKIIATDEDIQIELLSHPLTLRIFCEVTNPLRLHNVGVEAMPRSLIALFEKYIEQVIDRVIELAPRSRRYSQQDIRSALDKFGLLLWRGFSRNINFESFRKEINDINCQWNESLAHALEQNGILLRDSGNQSNGHQVKGIYDALSGYLIATSISSSYGRKEFQEWINKPSVIKKLSGQLQERHPLATDILRSFVGLVPRQYHYQQIWQVVNEPIKSFALLETTSLEGAYIDQGTVEELSKFIEKGHPAANGMFHRLKKIRSSINHPLNSEFLNSVLTKMTMAGRDIIWTEWIRNNKEMLLKDLLTLEKRWKEQPDKAIPADQLRILWIMWLLTSTVRSLRDQATKSLYWYGRANPKVIFQQTKNSLSINDPYISERMIAASYGISMALSANLENREFINEILPQYASELFELIFAKNATFSTTHALSRDYARHIIALAVYHKPKLLTTEQIKLISPPFMERGIRKWGRKKGYDYMTELGYGGPLHMDFANYTLGGLVPGRQNYDAKNPEYKKVIENVYWRIEQLGYTTQDFDEIDKKISKENWSNRLEGNEGRVDRYGKKYSWIAFFELYGYRYDKNLLKSSHLDGEERPAEVDIDPSFPDVPNDPHLTSVNWLGDRKMNSSSWIEKSSQPDILPYLMMEEIKGIEGPWILLDGYMAQSDKYNNRSVHTFIHGIITSKDNDRILKHQFTKSNFGTLRLPEIPDDSYTFAGEIPWCDTFPLNKKSILEIKTGERIEIEYKDEIRLYKNGKRVQGATKLILTKKLQDSLESKNPQRALKDLMNAEKLTYRKIKTKYSKKNGVYKKIEVLIPVRKNSWEGYHSSANSGRVAIIPARNISEFFGLTLQPPCWNMLDKNGKIASIWIKWGGNHWETGASLCYFRKDLLDRFLERKRMELFWNLWGTNEIILNYERFQEEKLKFSRKEFTRSFLYTKKGIKSGNSSERCF